MYMKSISAVWALMAFACVSPVRGEEAPKGADRHPHGGDENAVASIMDFFAQPEKAVKAESPAP